MIQRNFTRFQFLSLISQRYADYLILFLICEGNSIKEKLNNFKKLPKITNEEIERLKQYSSTMNSFNPGDDTNVFSNFLVDPLTKVSIPFSSRLLVKSSIHENYLDLDLESKGIDTESQIAITLSKNSITTISSTEDGNNLSRIQCDFSSVPSTICKVNNGIFLICFEDGTICEMNVNGITVNISNPTIVSMANIFGNYYSEPYHYICGDNYIVKKEDSINSLEKVLQPHINYCKSVFVDIIVHGNFIFVLDVIQKCIWVMQSGDFSNPQKVKIVDGFNYCLGMCKIENSTQNTISFLVADSGNRRIIKLDIENNFSSNTFTSIPSIFMENIEGYPIKIANENDTTFILLLSNERFISFVGDIRLLSHSIEQQWEYNNVYGSINTIMNNIGGNDAISESNTPQFSSMHYNVLKTMYYGIINFSGKLNNRNEWLGFIIGCGKDLLDCPVSTNIQSKKAGMMVSWENTTNGINHFGISINEYSNEEFEICNTLGKQYVLFDKEYVYDEFEHLFVIPSSIKPG